jgi:hypothetical protein
VTQEFKLYYHLENGGDGSANTKFHQSKQEAQEKDEGQSAGWGESSVGTLNLKVKDDQLYYQAFEMVDGRYQFVWKKVERSR